MGDVFKTCDLECQGKGIENLGNRHEFVGPVKIVLVESTPADYKRKIWFSALFAFIMLLLGATVFTVFFFTLDFRLTFKMNVHVLLCTMGFQLFMTTGIMMFSSLFGGSMMLKPAEKKFQHFFLEVCAVLFGLVGSLFALGNMSTSVHALTGFAGTLLTVATCLVGPTVYTRDPEKLFGLFNRRSHRNIGVPAYMLCTVCFALGFLKESFIKWLPCTHLNFILIGFTVVYSTIAVLCVLDRLFNGM